MPTANLSKVAYPPERCLTTPLPQLLQTPSGLALIEIQGTIIIGKHKLTSSGGFELENAGNDAEGDDSMDVDGEDDTISMAHLGEFDFSDIENGGTEVVLKLGKFQRLRGKVVKLKAPLAVLRVDPPSLLAQGGQVPSSQSLEEERQQIANDRNAGMEVPIVDIIYHKVLFSSRPEPIVYV